MTKSELFTLAHAKTKKQKTLALLMNAPFNYQVTFSFYLKQIINNQPQKITILGSKLANERVHKKVNKNVALVGDYKKPTYVRNGYKVTKQINSSLSVTFNLDTMLQFIMSAIAIVCIYALSLQAINYL